MWKELTVIVMLLLGLMCLEGYSQEETRKPEIDTNVRVEQSYDNEELVLKPVDNEYYDNLHYNSMENSWD